MIFTTLILWSVKHTKSFCIPLHRSLIETDGGIAINCKSKASMRQRQIWKIIILATLGFLSASHILDSFLNGLHPHTQPIILFHAFLALISIYVLMVGIKKSPIDSVTYTMLAFGLRMFLSICSLLFYFYQIQIEVYKFAVIFLIFFVIYSFMEVKIMLSFIKSNSSISQNETH